MIGADAIVGVSTHDETQIAAALQTTATYIAVGPVFGTRTKDTGYTARGLELVRIAAAHADGRLSRLAASRSSARAEVIEAGASSLAVISDLLTSDPAQRVREFLDRLPH